MTRRRYALALVVVLGTALISCQDRLATVDEEEPQKFCTGVNAARVYDEEGEPVGLVVDEEGNQTWICECLTLDEASSEALRARINDEAYALCLANAAAMGYPDPDDNDCAEYHASGHWGSKSMFQVWPHHVDVECDAGEPSAGCSVR